ncbi:MAG: glycosyltransferase family 4 protein [Methanomicrobiales archaeon]|nr:glycosyltransferase family 4 protein [Methanomicrobiales archaeon]MDI6875174.1 glycosyltransferase family 4 protein [Methanomicrobiales archaeon]
MDRLRIAVFCWESLPSVKVGGLAVAATNLAENAARNHEVHYFTPALEGQEKEAVINGVYYHRCIPKGSNIVEYCRDMSLQMVDDFLSEERDGEFDVLHFHDWHVTDALESLKDNATVFTFHSTEFGRNGNRIGNEWIFKEISEKERKAGLLSRKVTTVSQTLKKEVTSLYGLPEWKVDVVRNGIQPELYAFDVNPEEVKSDYGIPTDAPLILFAGRLTYQKGPDLLLEAIPKILRSEPDARFVFAGAGQMHDELKRRVRDLNGNAQFLGYVPDREFVRLLNACDILSIPSRNEPFGLILLEGWSAKKCVVASDVGGLSENIDHGVDGVKVQVDSNSLARGIRGAMGNWDDMARMGEMGRKKIESEFRWNIVTDKLIEVYQTCGLN